MRHAYDKALDIATELMKAQLAYQGFGTAQSQAEEIGKYFLGIVNTIYEGIKDAPDQRE